MRQLFNDTLVGCGRVLVATCCIAASLLAVGPRALAGCGCMDIALVVDDTGSMGGAIDNVKAGLPQIIATAQAAAGGVTEVAGDKRYHTAG